MTTKACSSLTRILVIIALGALSSCAPDERMPLADCDHGLYWADCGGDGEPVLGCDRESGACRWFTGGISARGHAISDCPATNPCCHENWPFDDFSPNGQPREVAIQHLSLLGRGIVERPTDGNISVGFDLAEDPGGRLEYCPLGAPESCVSWGGGTPVVVGSSLVIVYSSLSAGEHWEVELLPGASSDDWPARVFRFEDTGHEAPSPLACSGYAATAYDLEGELRLTTNDLSDPEAIHGRLVAHDDHHEYTFTF